ncbi:hypothetical protein CSC94_11440 [Zhengella mangrovi]|uniref:Uncharacterized protein n=1 Tax=Zhengella mangrovi TaxID=1982044 RepID=A0A2G1QNW5_9HYPH|nr:hypothetical protein [Zhengella mangrovi]PHP67150.1 hypothetical protein CSC94_11440 [Zhengella mangrovi]
MLETDSGYRTCVAGMISGFGNGLTETWCQTRYPLPSPFHFKCLEQLSSGFASELDRVACSNYFRTIAMRIEADASRR